MNQQSSYDPYAMTGDAVTDPPESLWLALRKIGPGIILAGGIVGTGELLLTTSFGAKYGFQFLWLILLSCVIKVFVQIELGRYAISSGKPTLAALNEMPGLRFGAHWLVWWWFFMFCGSVSQLGAMTGGTGQALALAVPGWDSVSFWAVVVCLAAIVLLFSGGYRRIERVTTFLVVGITLLTTICALALPFTDFPIKLDKVIDGLKFTLPMGENVAFAKAIAEAVAVFGITGVGASELYFYPYWCIEKGYARWTGPRDDSEAWARRARGWIRVMYLDAWVSMIVFTIATVAFYFMGAAVLHEQILQGQGVVPEKGKMIETLSKMYIGPFGRWTQPVFLIGAGCILFKTLYISCASHSRLISDFLAMTGWRRYRNPDDRNLVVQSLLFALPIVALTLYMAFGDPRAMTQVGGLAQAATLPVICGATVYLRFRRTDPRLAPSRTADFLFVVAVIVTSVVAIYGVGMQVKDLIAPAPAGR